MKKFTCLITVGLLLLLAAYSLADTYGIGTGIGVGAGTGGGASPPTGCDPGYDQLTGSDTNVINDSTGGLICCPQ